MKMTRAATPNSDLLNRLNRIEGRVRGISRIVEHDKYCIDIFTQVSGASVTVMISWSK